MAQNNQQQPSESEVAVYRAAILRGAVSGAVRALIAWILQQ